MTLELLDDGDDGRDFFRDIGSAAAICLPLWLAIAAIFRHNPRQAWGFAALAAGIVLLLMILVRRKTRHNEKNQWLGRTAKAFLQAVREEDLVRDGWLSCRRVDFRPHRPMPGLLIQVWRGPGRGGPLLMMSDDLPTGVGVENWYWRLTGIARKRLEGPDAA